ncbi:MAG: haloacid dehalogenase type II [Candidatus Tectimicrobiota bacterium]
MHFENFQVLTFDCYGTLIDWETGLWKALQPIFARHRVTLHEERALELFGELEAAAEAEPYRDYATILRSVLESMGRRLGFTPTPEEGQHFARSVKDWPAFADVPRALQALQQHYKLAIISNIDDELFALSAPRLQVRFDWVITAQQARSYKPAPRHFQLAFERLGVPQSAILHIAQSLFHDIAPARALGLATVWVNRRQQKPGFGATPPVQAQPDLEVPDVQTLAARMGLL